MKERKALIFHILLLSAIIILLLLQNSCQKQDITEVETECDKMAKRLNVQGDYFCEFKDGEYLLYIKKNEANKQICDSFQGEKRCD